MKKSLYFSISSLSAFILLYSDSCAILVRSNTQIVPVKKPTDIILSLHEHKDSTTIENSIPKEEALERLQIAHHAGQQKLEAHNAYASANQSRGPTLKQRCRELSLSDAGNNQTLVSSIGMYVNQKTSELSALLQKYISHVDSPGFDETSLHAACALLESGNPSSEAIAKVNEDLSELVKKLTEENSHLRQLALRQKEQEIQQQFQQVAMEAATKGVAVGGILSAQATLLNGGVPESFVAVVISVLLELQSKLQQQNSQNYLELLTNIANLIAKAGNQAEKVFGEEVSALIGKKNPKITMKDPNAQKILDKYDVIFEEDAVIPPDDALKLLEDVANFSKNKHILPQYMEIWKDIVVQITAKSLSEEQMNLVLEAIADSINNSDTSTLKEAIGALVKNPTNEELLFKVQSGKYALRIPESVKIPTLDDYGDSDCIPHEHGPREGFNTVTWSGENPTLTEILDSIKKPPKQADVVCLINQFQAPYTILPPLIAPELTTYPSGSKGAYRKKPGARLDFRDRVAKGEGEIKVAVPIHTENWDATYTATGVNLPTVDTEEIKYSTHTLGQNPWLFSTEHLKEHLHSIDPKDISFLNRSQMTLIPLVILEKLSVPQVHAFTNVVIQHFSPDQISVLFQHLALWQLFCIQSDAVKKVTWDDLCKKYISDMRAIQNFPIMLIPHLYMRNHDEEIKLNDPILPNSIAHMSAPSPPAGGRKHNDDINSLNCCFTKMSPDQIQAISLRHIQYLSTTALGDNNKVQLLTAGQWNEWVKCKGTHIVEIVPSLTPMQCTCIPKEQLNWALIEQMKLEQVLLLSPLQVSLIQLPVTTDLNKQKKQIHNIISQKKAVSDLDRKLATVNADAKNARSAKNAEILARYDRCYWHDATQRRKFCVHRIEIDIKNEMYKVTKLHTQEYLWEELKQYGSGQNDNIGAILQTIPSLEVFFGGIGSDPTALQYARQFRKIQTKLNQDLSEHIVVGTRSSASIGVATIESISLADPVTTQSRTLKEYLLKKLSASETMEIDDAETMAKNSGNSRAMQSLDEKTKDFLENLTWNPDSPPVPELTMLALQHTNASEDAQHICRSNLTTQLNEMYYYSGYLLHDRTLLYIPPKDIRKIKELKQGDSIIPGDTYISNPELGFDKECIFSNSPYTLDVPSTICMRYPDKIKHLDLGQDKISLKEKYSSKNGTFITMPSLSTLSTVTGNIFQGLKGRFVITVKNPEAVIAIWINKLVEFLEKYGTYWIVTSDLQRRAIATLSSDDQDQFAPYLLPYNTKDIKGVVIYFLNIWHQQTQTTGNMQLSDLLRKCLDKYSSIQGSFNKDAFAAALKK